VGRDVSGKRLLWFIGRSAGEGSIQMLRQLLFDAPWWLPTAIIALGVYVFVLGNRRQEKRVMYVGVALALLGVSVAVTSYLVETDRERAVRRTRELVAAADHRDWNAFRSLIDPKTSLYGLRGPDAITDAARAGVERINVTNIHITGLDVEKNDTDITISIRVLSDISGNSSLTDWQLRYQDFGHGWELYSVQALSNQQIPEDRIKNEIRARQ
jgi:hypothetical protein